MHGATMKIIYKVLYATFFPINLLFQKTSLERPLNSLFKFYRYVLYGFLYLIGLDICCVWVQVFVTDRIFIANLITLWKTL